MTPHFQNSEPGATHNSTPGPKKGTDVNSLFDSVPDTNGGEALRDCALNQLRDYRPELIRQFSVAAIRIALDTGEVCADDVRALVSIPDGINPKFVGCVFRDLADAGILRRDGYQLTKRAIAHARPISRWRLADALKATARLTILRTA